MTDEFSKVPDGRVRLYKAAARVPTYGGVPSMAIAVVGTFIVVAGALVSLWAYLLVVPAWIILAAITKTDDRALRQWWLWLHDTAWPALRYFDSYKLWGAVSFGAMDYSTRGWR